MKKHNKSMEIRKAARELVSQGNPPRPSEIVARLKAKGIVTYSQQVSMALSKTEFAYRNQEAQALGQVSIEDVFKAKKFVADLGTIEKAMAALVALQKFKGYTTPNTPPQPPQTEENKDIRQNKTFIAEIQAAEQHRELITD